jgi:ATP-dependent RNA helicase SUPV3L1/SUV3
VSTLKTHDTQALDALTGGAFTAPTSGERAARLRDWLAGEPSAEQMQEVFRELSARDKGAARLLREKLDEIKRAKGQEAIAAEWAEKARSLLAQPRLNIADAMAWQRDAAKAGAPLSREPLAGVKTELADRIRGIEDLQNRVQVQREAAVLLAQRIEVLSTKSWRDAQAAADALRTDVPQWQAQAQSLLEDPNWGSVDPRFPPLLEASRTQLQVVWDSFQSALGQAIAAAEDAGAPLPPVPVWAEELRQARGLPAETAPTPKAARPKADPEQRERANKAVSEALAKVEQEVAQGHGKASAGAANALRNALKEHGKLVDDKLEAQAHAALGAATELEGWQRWRADQLRQELVAKAEALFEPVPAPAAQAPAAAAAAEAPEASAEAPAVQAEAPAATSEAPAAEAEAGTDAIAAASDVSVTPAEAPAAAEPAAAEPAAAEAPKRTRRPRAAPVARKPRYGGRKMQETLRSLREQWKQVDQGGPPNHALWKRFDEACNEAYKVVQEWLDKVKAEAAEHRSARLALIEEVKAWAAAHPEPEHGDWKGFNRALHQFSDRWREAGHLSEKAFAELQPQWKEAIGQAAAPLERAQKASIERRNAMIEEARVLGDAPMLRIDAVKALQQRWQGEAQTVPLDRKQEQKLWDAFRKPIDDAFNRKTQEREKAAASLSGRDRAVLEASKAVEEATASGDAQKIRAAMAALEQALRARDDAAAAAAPAAPAAAPAAEGAEAPAEATTGEAGESAEAAAAPAPAPKAPPKPVIAMRGDDRPGARRPDAAPAGRPGKFDPRRPGPGGRDMRDDRRGGFGRDRDDREDRGPRLGDAAFRAQREALEHAQAALRKLAAQAHGEALTQLMTAWEQRSAEQVPSHAELGKVVSPQVRQGWLQALGQPASGDPVEALLRLEIAADVPTPAEQIQARRQMQLQLLTRRHEASPQETWGADVARVLATGYDANAARRLQNALKALLRR